ncbi:MAG: DUF1566 domain-containing protein, partial [Rhodoferax sp.]|nr:DUF1566 domain-containing protein [Rhodoferax sp.]
TPFAFIADSGKVFTVVVRNSAGTVISSGATLNVSPPAAGSPVITAQPADQSRATGQTASFSVSATGTAPLTYQWMKDGNHISDATSSSYTTDAIGIADHGARYSVAVSNSAGTVISRKAILSDTSQPMPQSVVAGATATFSVTAAGAGPFTHQWKRNGSDISGATSSSYTTSATAIGDSGAEFSVVVSSAGGTVTSSPATLTVLTTTARYSQVSKPDGTLYSKEECVKDNITGLIWEGKPSSGDRAATNGYTNYDSTASAQKGVGSNPTVGDIDASTNSIGYVRTVNASALCGFTDWYLPSRVELPGIVKSGAVSPSIDTAWFFNTQSNYYWTSSPFGND